MFPLRRKVFTMEGVLQPCCSLGARPSGSRIKAKEAAIRNRPTRSISTQASWIATDHDL